MNEKIALPILDIKDVNVADVAEEVKAKLASMGVDYKTEKTLVVQRLPMILSNYFGEFMMAFMLCEAILGKLPPNNKQQALDMNYASALYNPIMAYLYGDDTDAADSGEK